MKTWLLPLHYERRYARFLKKTVAQLRKELLLRLGDVIRLQTRTSSNVGIESDELSIAAEDVLTWWRAKREENKRTYAGYFGIVNVFNDTQFVGVVKSLTGLAIPPTQSGKFTPGQLYSTYTDLINRFGESADVFRQETFLQPLENNWVSTQDVYVDNVVTQTVKETELIVRNNIITSATSSIIRQAINSKLDTVEKRVEQTAKDQISTLDAVLTRERQKSLGANEYVWETRRDERVRGNPTGLYPNAKPSHFARQGEVFSWKRPPEGGHPGEAFGCRCRALMKLPTK